MISANVTANGSGQATLAIEPMLRRSPSDNDALNLAPPYIEGLLDGDQRGWTVSNAKNVGLQFRITEAE
jgi:hypothetical protein